MIDWQPIETLRDRVLEFAESGGKEEPILVWDSRIQKPCNWMLSLCTFPDKFSAPELTHWARINAPAVVMSEAQQERQDMMTKIGIPWTPTVPCRICNQVRAIDKIPCGRNDCPAGVKRETEEETFRPLTQSGRPDLFPWLSTRYAAADKIAHSMAMVHARPPGHFRDNAEDLIIALEAIGLIAFPDRVVDVPGAAP